VDFFRKLIGLLEKDHVWSEPIYRYALQHNELAPLREWLRHRDDFLAQCGPWLDAKPIRIDPIERRAYEHLEYSPLINQRAHRLGADNRVANPVLRGQYEALLRILAHKTALDAMDDMSIVYFLFLQDRTEEALVRFATIKPEALRCLEDLQRCEHEGWARTLFMRSKAIELFCHLLKLLEQDEGFGAPEASQVTSRGVLRAQRILKSRYVSPPSLDDLAREVGVSRSGLCAGFRQLLGKSIFGYIQDLRMERALTLLNETQTSITEIAHAVGYSHLSNFTVAVQRRFGMSPKELRRNASGVDTPQ